MPLTLRNFETKSTRQEIHRLPIRTVTLQIGEYSERRTSFLASRRMLHIIFLLVGTSVAQLTSTKPPCPKGSFRGFIADRNLFTHAFNLARMTMHSLIALKLDIASSSTWITTWVCCTARSALRTQSRKTTTTSTANCSVPKGASTSSFDDSQARVSLPEQAC